MTHLPITIPISTNALLKKTKQVAYIAFVSPFICQVDVFAIPAECSGYNIYGKHKLLAMSPKMLMRPQKSIYMYSAKCKITLNV